MDKVNRFRKLYEFIKKDVVFNKEQCAKCKFIDKTFMYCDLFDTTILVNPLHSVAHPPGKPKLLLNGVTLLQHNPDRCKNCIEIFGNGE